MKFDIVKSIQKWAKENNHDGFYCNEGDPCGCKIEDLAPCGHYESIIDGDCLGGKLHNGKFVNSDGDECEWAIIPHDYKEGIRS